MEQDILRPPDIGLEETEEEEEEDVMDGFSANPAFRSRRERKITSFRGFVFQDLFLRQDEGPVGLERSVDGSSLIPGSPSACRRGLTSLEESAGITRTAPGAPPLR